MSIAARAGNFVRTYSTGVIAACVSVVFASYMLLTRDGRNVLPQATVAVRHAPVISPLKKAPEKSIVPANMITGATLPVAGDALITGSLGRIAGGKQSLLMPLREARKSPGRRGRLRYVLRFATPQVALVENSGRVWSVEPGDLLPGAGRVIRIERKGPDKWALKTFDGKRISEITSR